MNSLREFITWYHRVNSLHDFITWIHYMKSFVSCDKFQAVYCLISSILSLSGCTVSRRWLWKQVSLELFCRFQFYVVFASTLQKIFRNIEIFKKFFVNLMEISFFSPCSPCPTRNGAGVKPVLLTFEVVASALLKGFVPRGPGWPEEAAAQPTSMHCSVWNFLVQKWPIVTQAKAPLPTTGGFSTDSFVQTSSLFLLFCSSFQSIADRM